MEPLVRPVSESDLDSLVTIFRACWLTSYSDILSQTVRNEMTEDRARAMWALSVHPHPDRTTFVIEQEGETVGMARIGRDVITVGRGHLFSLYVHPDNAGRGLGKKLLLHSLKFLRETRFDEISLWVFKNNVSTRNLYTSLGFYETGQERIDDRWKNLEIEMLAPSNLF